MNVLVTNRTQDRIPERRIKYCAAEILRCLVRRGWRKFSTYELGIAFVGARESRILNERFLRKSKPANVLSFDYGSSGELILCPGVIRREAAEAHETFDIRLLRLLVHGAVHLSGVHHEKHRTLERKAEKLEAALAKHLGCTGPAATSPPVRRGRGRTRLAHYIRRH